MPKTIKGRGAHNNPPNRFDRIHIEDNADWDDDSPSPITRFYSDRSKSILAKNNSPDVPFTYSLNPYRGCEHGCAYCYARPTHETFGLSAGLDFETKIFVKENAPELLRAKLSSPGWKPQTVAISGVTDPYQPVERELEITRKCLEVFAEFLNPVTIITKSKMVTRDIDILSLMARGKTACVCLTVTTLDETVRRVLEPRAASSQQRLAAVKKLSQAGIPVGILIAPVIPGLTDHEIPAIISAAVRSGARFAGYVPLRLPYAVAPLFQDWLSRHFPLLKKKVMNQIKDLRGGKLNEPEFGKRMRGEGIYARQMESVFRVACHKSGMGFKGPELSTESFKNSANSQLDFFVSL